MRIILTEGQVHDIRQAEALIEGFACEKVLADKGYDSDKFREVIASKGAEAVIPPKRSRKELLPYDKDVYQDRNLAAYPVDSGSSICSVLSDRPRSVAGTYTDGQGALAF